jgi:hypothetical protein
MIPTRIPSRRFAGFRIPTALAVAGLLAAASSVTAQSLFTDDFNTDSSANWNVFEGSGNGTPDYTAEWAFDYSTTTYTFNGQSKTIPPSPNGGGTTKGLKLTVNKDDTAATAAVSVYPKNQTFSGDFSVKFDLWLNYNGPAYGGTGSTEHGTFGINHLGTQVNWSATASVSDGVWFSMAGEAGAGVNTISDYGAYVGDNIGGAIWLRGTDGGYVHGEEVNPNQAATSGFKQIFYSPDFESAGAPGKHWVQVELRQRVVDGTPVVTWLMDGYVIAEHSQGSVFSLSSGNLMLGLQDFFSGIASPKAENFAIYDNLRVENLTGQPAKPVVSILPVDADAGEPGDTASFTVSRTGDTAQALDVALRIGGTAVAGTDYDALPATVTIPAGEAATTVTVTPKNDELGEAEESILVTIAGGAAYDIRADLTAVLRLLDDGDVPVATLSVTKPVAYEGNPARVARFVLNFASNSLADVVVNFTVGGTAVNGTDYNTLGTSVTIPAGETRAVVDVVPKNNTAVDAERTVSLTLGTGAGYKLGEAVTGSATIRNDDLAAGTPLYSENFDADATANWTVNVGPTDGVADFFFDYSTVGIPPAPNTTGGTTRGLKLQANLTTGVFGGLSVSPNGKSFSDDYRLRFDLWQSFNGPLPAGGSGSTQITGAGIGTAGATPQWPGGTQDSIWFAATADGGSTVDYRAYSPAAATGYLDPSGVFAAGTTGAPRNEANAYYSEFGREAAPEAQLALFPDQTGETFVGAQGFQWRDVVIEKRGNEVTWFIDGLRIATVNAAEITLGGGNILFNYADINAGSSTDPDSPSVAFGLVDNVRVEQLSAPVTPLAFTAPTLSPDGIVLTWTGGTGPFLVQGKLSLTDAAWLDLKTTAARSATIPLASPVGFFRVADGTAKTVALYRASLDAAQEGGGVVSPATGTGLLAVDGTTATYVLGYQDLVGTLSNAHVHGPAPAGQSAPPLFNITFTAGTRAGLITGQATIDAAAAGHLAAGNTYFNLHTSSFGGGEIRGQLLAVP